MEVAALVLSIIAIASCSCIYVSIICGSLAMIFALLSKGGATSMSSMAMTSFWIAFAAEVAHCSRYRSGSGIPLIYPLCFHIREAWRQTNRYR